MTWEQKAVALQAAVFPGLISLRFRKEGDWYVNKAGLERKEGGCLSSGYESGKTPQDAVEQAWEWAIAPDYYLVKYVAGSTRRAVKWNGFMWEDVVEDK